MSSANASSDSRRSQTFVDTATDCAICLSPLSNEQTITLGCGHLWHLSCIHEQLKHAQPNPSKRLLFSGCRCGKCGAFCDHPLLASVTRSTNILRGAVDALISEQVIVDGLHNDPQVLSPNSPFYGDAIALGRSLYAFFQCSICKGAYFGGTIACADAEDEILPPGDRMCPNCAPGTSIVCAHDVHTAFHVWKCRYCCRSATHVCYGRTHFCDDCHERNGRRGSGEALAPIECPGAPSCRTPLQRGKTHHSNGASHTCELILNCTLCASDPTGLGARIDTRNASPNMVFNPRAALGLRGWINLEFMNWTVETSAIRFRDFEFNFVSSYDWCNMRQIVDLRRFLIDPGSACLEISARYMARTDCPSWFRLQAVVYSVNMSELARFSSGTLAAPADFWEPVKHVFMPLAGATYVAILVSGKDGRMWHGDYGSKVTDISLRVLFDRSALRENDIVKPGAFERIMEPNNAPSVESAEGCSLV